MEKEKDTLRVNPIIAKLAKVAESDSVVVLEGSIGPSKTNIVRLYPDFTMVTYVDIPKEDIVHAEEVADAKDGRVRLWVLASAKVTETSVHHMDAKDYVVTRQRRRPEDIECRTIRAVALYYVELIADFAAKGDQRRVNRLCNALDALEEIYDSHSCSNTLGAGSFPVSLVCDPDYPIV